MSDPANDRAERCLDCGAALMGAFCGSCGQRSTGRMDTREVLGDVVSNLFGLAMIAAAPFLLIELNR